jgi:predicted DNA-binding protein
MAAIQLKLPAEILERLDRVAGDRFETRATVIRSYIVRGLKADMQGSRTWAAKGPKT